MPENRLVDRLRTALAKLRNILKNVVKLQDTIVPLSLLDYVDSGLVTELHKRVPGLEMLWEVAGPSTVIHCLENR